jgi:hypothetical protein
LLDLILLSDIQLKCRGGGAGLLNLSLRDNNLGEPASTGTAKGLLILLLFEKNLGEVAIAEIDEAGL